MNENEAIRRIEDHMRIHRIGEPPHHKIAEALNLAVAALREQAALRWIPVAERKPEKASEYLCRCCINGSEWYPFHMVLRYYLVDKSPHFQHEGTGGMNITHWMPIPELPKEENEDERH